MIYFLALIPATALTVGGYVVLFLSDRSEGAFRAFGKYLGFWAFTLAGLVILGAIFAAAHRPYECPPPWMGGGMHGMGRMHGPMSGGPPGGPPPPPAEAPNPPAPPPVAAPPPK